ncbi:uncharacterized protein LOC124155926 [Ischnura elegans]|uniref:uncharacterized protein LOC124155926 n=1 Tax=Ischnura elegans TaxID=197161 RepID=UPI001ED899CE|nr:uncharacterized protein LOC124155926 [Ischnura elegans]
MPPSVVDMIKMETPAGHAHPHHRLAGIYEFRLQGSREDSDAMTSTAVPAAATTASSVGSDRLSLHKQKIDSMFDETRSSVSGAGTPTFSRRGRVILDDLEEEDEEEYDDMEDGKQNTVQERIQKMFASVAEDERFKDSRVDGRGEESRGRSVCGQDNFSQSEMKSSSQPNSSAFNNFSAASVRPHVFSVHYLGSAPLPNRDATLQALQYPLKTLYFRYRALEICGRAPPLNGTLEISSEGLRVKMSRPIEERKPGIAIKTENLDKLNKFPSIAVWAAVKFVKKDPEEATQVNDESSSRFAFLPLIADPEGRDKSSLFRTLRKDETELALGSHSPMFAVVMRRSSRANGPNGIAKRTLHCHAFVCACSEDAIVMAANLYQALVAGMSAGRKSKSKQENEEEGGEDSAKEHRAPDQVAHSDSRVVNSVPSRPSSVPGGDLKSRGNPSRPSDVMSSVSAPVRPPRRKKSVSRYGDDARSSNSEDFLSLEDEEETKKKEQPPLRRVSSALPLLHKSSSSVSLSVPKMSMVSKDTSGDIFTRVAIPRSGSFLEHGANLRRSSSMGLADLFLEVRAQEGLNSLDDILEKIVDTDGMSYARLKPLYREFLLKLAATLSRDELYQRSKSIMRRQASSRRRRRKTRVATSCASEKKCPKEDEDYSSASGDNCGEETKPKFPWSLCTSAAKIRSKSSSGATRGEKTKEGGKRSTKSGGGGEGTSCNFEFTSVIFPSENRRARARAGSSSISSSVSSASRGSKSRRQQRRKQFHAHRPSFNAGRTSRGSQPPARPAGAADARSRLRVSTSEDSSDFFSFKRRTSVRNVGGTVDTNTKSSSRMGSSHGTVLGGGRSSSGYVSCSDCSFDSESCNSDKCYCPQEPLRRHQNGRVPNGGNWREPIRNGMYAELQHLRGGRPCMRSDDGIRGAANQQPGVVRGHHHLLQCRARQPCAHQCAPHECGCRALTGCVGGMCHSTPPCQGSGGGCRRRELRCQQHHVAESCHGCCCLTRADSPSTAWRKNEGRVTGRAVAEGSGALAEEEDEEDWEDEEDGEEAMVLEDGASAESSSSWRPGSAVPRSRMEVYATLPPPRPLPHDGQQQRERNGTENGGSAVRGRTQEMECRQRSSHVLDCVANLEATQQKVLVVSARDPKGRVICMGRGDQSNIILTSAHGHHVNPGRRQHCSKSAATEALSVKKSAEIAAIFSGSHNHVGSHVSAGEEVIYTTLEPSRQSVIRSKGSKVEYFSGKNLYSRDSLETTLGYLP